MQRIQKTIRDFLDDQPIPSVGPDDPVATALEVMKAHGSYAVLVLDGDVLVGIFTGRDFLNRVAALRHDVGATSLRDVMTPDPECLRPHDSIAYAINRMAVRGFRNIPIVDDDRRAVAVLDIRTVTAHLTDVFADVSEADPRMNDEWTDIGGG